MKSLKCILLQFVSFSMNQGLNNPVDYIFNQASRWLARADRFFIALLVFIFLLTGVLTLHHYGLSWDEGLGNLFFGERYLHYFLSFNQVFLDFKAELPLHQQHAVNLYHSPFREVPHEFPPVADTLSAASMYLFSYQLGWLNPVDGFHLFSVLFAGVLLFALYCFTAPRYGKFCALMAVVFIAAFPRFWADMHFNVKDIPQTIFFGLVIFAFAAWYEKPVIWRAALVGWLWGLALGVKANALFIPIIILAGTLPWSISRTRWGAWLRLMFKNRLHYLIMGLTAVTMYFVSWPYLYAHPLNNLLSYWRYIFSQGGRSGGTTWNIDPLRQIATTTPEVMLAGLLVGLVLLAAKTRRGVFADKLLIAWLAFPVLRASLPGMVNFDGIRHFLEFLPAAAIIAGMGVDALARWLQSRKLPKLAAQVMILALLAINLIPIYRVYGPYTHIYYNLLTGGLSGARQGWLGDEAADYWAVTYRRGMEWMRLNAPSGAQLYATPAEWLVTLSAPVFLRPDIQVNPQDHLPDFTLLEQSPEPVYVMFNLRQGPHQDELAYCQARKQPVYQVIVDNVPVLQIYLFGDSGS